MNRLAYTLSLRSTNFANAHGLSNKSNRSTAGDLGRLACLAMKQYPLIRKIGNTQQHTATVTDYHSRVRQITWVNTNLLLAQEGFEGLKTGWTPNAGPCLIVLYAHEDVNILITVMNSKSVERRFTEAQRLAYWAE
jgi:D-alanyl-D-alanine carboxypeptidase